MIAHAQPSRPKPAATRQRFLAKTATRHAIVLTTIAVLAVASSALTARAFDVQRESATAIGQLQDQRLLTEQIATLGAQYALGRQTARDDLARTIDALSAGGQHASGRRNDPMAAYLAQARAVATMTPANLRASAAAVPAMFAARTPILEHMQTAIRAREARSGRDLAGLQTGQIASTVGLLGTLLVYALGLVRPLARRASRLAAEAAEFARVATIDPLTGTLNKRSFHDRGAIEFQKAKRYNRPLSLLVIDTDHFDALSKAHGHDGGDTILRALTTTLFDGTRATDLVGRVGSEEFAILLPETGPAGAQLLAERLRSRISDLVVPVDDVKVSCTVSIGVAAAEHDASFFWPTFQRADEALYEAKMRGRNRVVVNAV